MTRKSIKRFALVLPFGSRKNCGTKITLDLKEAK